MNEAELGRVEPGRYEDQHAISARTRSQKDGGAKPVAPQDQQEVTASFVFLLSFFITLFIFRSREVKC